MTNATLDSKVEADRPELSEHTMPAGTVFRIHGVPVELVESARVLVATGNYKLSVSHLDAALSNPTHAAESPVMSSTNSSSFESM